jgi:hypothetical protein
VVLLLLVVVAQLSLPLGRHPTLCLSHLVRIVGPLRVALVLVETLDVRGRVGAHAVILAHGMMALGAAHALFCWVPSAMFLDGFVVATCVRTVVGIGARCRTGAAAAHHWHRLATSTARWRSESGAERLPALGEVFRGALDFCSALSAKGSKQ